MEWKNTGLFEAVLMHCQSLVRSRGNDIKSCTIFKFFVKIIDEYCWQQDEKKSTTSTNSTSTHCCKAQHQNTSLEISLSLQSMRVKLYTSENKVMFEK